MAGRLLIGDCRESLRTLPEKSVHCCVTSPPYWGLRDYGVDGQLGLEKSPAEYVAGMVSVFAEVWRVLRDDGVCWINIGDSYAGSTMTGGNNGINAEGGESGFKQSRQFKREQQLHGLKPKDLVGIPWRLAFALQDAGWYLRQDVIWHKPNPMPESVRDRCTKAHEYMFLLTKSARYFFDGDAIKTKTSAKTLTVKTTPRKGTGLESTGEKINAWMEGNGGRYHPEESNRRSVWTIATHSYRGAHFACVDSETEALTRSGWKRESDLKDGESILAFNRATGCLEWQEATFHRYSFDGEMVSIQKRDSSQLLTPNHRCLVRKRTKRGYTTMVVEAENLNSRMDLVVSAPWGDISKVTIGEEFAELCGWYVTEGEKPRAGGSVRINQSVSANPEKVDRIRALLVAVGAVFTEGVRVRHVNGRKSVECRFTVKGDVAKKLWETCPGKMVPEWSHELCEKDAVAMLRGVVDGDGHRRLNDGRQMIVQKNRDAIERMQILAIRCGYRTILTENARDNRLYLTTGRLLTLRGTNGAGPAYKKRLYSGVVWCPSVASGFWLARRDGKPFVTGNTYPPKLVEPCILAGTSARGCCPACGAPWRRVVESQRVATRPGTGSKVTGDTLTDGNRDPQRHVAIKKTTGWEQTCKCEAHEPIPCTILDPFMGSGTTAIVAEHHGREWVGCELSEAYAELARQRIAEGWHPKPENRKRLKRARRGMRQLLLIGGNDADRT